MNNPSKRNRQIADLIHTQIALLLKKEVNDPRLNHVSITSVRISSDLANADVYFIMPDVNTLGEVTKAFTKAKGYLRSMLANSVDLRYVPKLNFLFDKSLEQGSKVSELIDYALSQDEQLRKLRKENDE